MCVCVCVCVCECVCVCVCIFRLHGALRGILSRDSNNNILCAGDHVKKTRTWKTGLTYDT